MAHQFLLVLLVAAARCQAQIYDAIQEDACQSDGSCSTALLQTANARKEATSVSKPMKSLVINLDTRPDRWEHMQGQLKPLITSGAIKVERVPGVNGSTANWEGQLEPEHNLEQILQEVTDEWFSMGMSKSMAGKLLKVISRGEKWEDGERGCTLSHFEVWKKVAAGTEPVLVLEDDLVIDPDLADIIAEVPKMPKEVEFLYLQYRTAFQGLLLLPLDPTKDGHSLGKEVGHITKKRNIWEADFLLDTGAYIIWPAAAQTLLDQRPFANSVGLQTTYLVHTGGLKGHAVYPAPVHQLSEMGYLNATSATLADGDIIRGGKDSNNGGWLR